MAAAVGGHPSDPEQSSAPSGSAVKGAPCLLCIRRLPDSSKEGALAVGLCPSNDGPPPGSVVFQNEIPKHLRGHGIINSLENHIVVEDRGAHRGIKLVDPFSPSWPVLAVFPWRCRHPDRDYQVTKVVAPLPFSPGSVAVSINGLFCSRLVCATQGADCWTVRDDLTRCGIFQDLILRKQDGLFYALTDLADKVFSLGFSVDADGRIDDVSIHHFDIVPSGDHIAEAASRGRCVFQEARFVDSPSGLFVVRWRMTLMWNREEKKERAVDVYRFSPEEKAWAPVTSLDGYSFLIDCKQSLAISTADFPDIPRNRIYICSDAAVEMQPRLVNVGRYDDDIEYNLIYDLGSGSWEHWEPLYGPQHVSSGLTLWMMLPSSVVGKAFILAPSSRKRLPAGALQNSMTSSLQTPVLEAALALEPASHVKEETPVKIFPSHEPGPESKVSDSSAPSI